MPTYEYKCDACGNGFDEYQSFSDKPLKKCPKCKKSKLRRLFGTGAAVLFKGSGFYQTDYRSESYKSAAKADAAPSSTSATTAKDGANGTAGTSKTTEPAKAASSSKKTSSS
jgi:putative FmdB family regulatory protein